MTTARRSSEPAPTARSLQEQPRSGGYDDDLAYWTDRLAGAPPALELPADRARPPVQSFAGATHSFDFPSGLESALATLARATETTPFMVLLAAYQALLHRYTNETDVVVGCPVANRTRTEVEDVVGFFVNTLVMRIDLSGDPAFDEVLRRARAMALEAYVHQDLPFEKLVEHLNPERDLARQPLFQVTFSFQDAPRQTSAGGLVVTPAPVDTAVSKFDLSLTVTASPGRMGGSFQFSTDLFDESTIARMAGHYVTLLEAVVAQPSSRLSQLPLLTDAERDVLDRWNDTAVDHPRHRLVHEIVEQRARSQPDVVAAVDPRGSITYAELDAAANRLASRLRARGVGPEVVVGVYVDASTELLVCLLAVLKAGGAYLPLDRSYPRDRLAYMVRDSAAAIVLGQRDRPLGGDHDAEVVVLDDDPSTPEAATDPVASGCAPGNLAYVIYTSGSTGVPKGVMVPHAGLLNLVCWHLGAYPIEPGESLTQVAALAFDASVWEIWPALAGGGAVFFPEPDERVDPERLFAWMGRSAAVVAFLPTPLGESLLASEARGALGLRVLNVGGDALTRWPDERTPFEVVNHYGPSEGSVVSTCVRIAPCDSVRRPPIGKPIDNVRTYVLDGRGAPVPVGVPGEIYVGGANLARGYAGRPGLTAEKFVPDPFGDTPGARLYRTGDLARYLPDGNLEFVGRVDHQVKIRGFRIEVGEIEARLLEHDAVLEAVVVVRTDPRGSPHLVAYLSLHDGEQVGAAELRAHLQTVLPDYMVPSQITMLERLPMSLNGKVDRDALPEPDFTTSSHPYVAPRDPVEQELAGIWSSVLGVERIGIDDDFFELGGHSLLATQVVSRIRRVFGVDVPLPRLFRTPTIASLARAVAEHEERPGEVAAIARLRQLVASLPDEEVAARLSAAQAASRPRSSGGVT